MGTLALALALTLWLWFWLWLWLWDRCGCFAAAESLHRTPNSERANDDLLYRPTVELYFEVGAARETI